MNAQAGRWRPEKRGVSRRSFVKRAAAAIGAIATLPWTGLQVFARAAYGYGGPYWVPGSRCAPQPVWGYCEPLIGCILGTSSLNPGGTVYSPNVYGDGCSAQCYIEQGKNENCQVFVCLCGSWTGCICYCNVMCY